MKYEWVEGYRDKLSPEVVANELRRIEEKKGVLDAELVVEYAKSKKSPIHDAFEWDNSLAAHEYRLTQARTMIRSLRVVVEDATQPKRLFWHTVEQCGKNQKSMYVLRDRLGGEAELQEATYREVVSQLKGLRARYAELKELSDIWEKIDEL